MSSPGISVWPVLPPDVYLQAPRRLPFPLEEPGCSLFARARGALWQGLPRIGLRPGDEVLAPAYHHGSEIEALERAGIALRFYDAADGLAPEEDQLDALRGPRTRALYLVHYLGLPQDAPRWRRYCDARGLALVEDGAQAWLASRNGVPVGRLADLAIFCLYKTLGLPDGAALLVPSGRPGPAAPRPVAEPPLGLVPLARAHLKWLLARSDALARLAPTRAGGYSAAADFALGIPGRPPSQATMFLLSRLADPQAAERRRANYRLLAQELGASPRFPELGDGASPFAFPFESRRKAALLDRLRQRGIAGLNLWSTPHPSLPAGRHRAAGALRRGIVGLPVHQELAPDDLRRVVAAVRAPRRAPTPLALEIHTSFDGCEDDWREAAGSRGPVFATREWHSTWWRHLGGEGERLVLAICRAAGGRAVAVLPLYLQTLRPVRTLRFLGHSLGAQLGPVCAPVDRMRVGDAVRRLMRMVRADVLVGEHMDGRAGWPATLGSKGSQRATSPVVRTAGLDWAAFLGARSANFRQQVRRKERQLAGLADLRYRMTDDPERLDADLDTLFALHRARWDGGTGVFAGAKGAFHREFAREALLEGWLRLWFLELDGCPVAAWHGFRRDDVDWYYQSGRDPGAPGSPGWVLLMHTLRTAFDDGMREYRLGPGEEPYKTRLADDDPGLETVIVGAGATGTALATAAMAAARAEAPRRTARALLGA